MADQPLRNAGAAQIEQEAILAGAGPVDAEPDAEYAGLGERLGELIESLETHPDQAVGQELDELLVAFDRLHRDALRRLAGLLAQHQLLEHAFTDPVVAMVLDLYDLRPEAYGGAETAGEDTSQAAPPAATSRPAPAAPMIRLQDIRRFPAATMPASAATPATGPKVVENLLAPPASAPSATPPPRAPSATRPPRPASAAASDAAASSRPAAPLADESGAVVPAAGPPTWTTLFAVEHAPAGALVASADGEVLICNLDGVLHAVRNRCGGTPLPLHFGEIADGRLICPWHKVCGYDLVTGESSSGRRTVVYPVRLDGDRISVALNHGRSTGPLQPTGLRAAPM